MKSVFKLSPSTKVTLEVMVLPSLLVLMVVLVLSVFVANGNHTESHSVSNHGLTYYSNGGTVHHMYH